ncbi:MAG TPA: uroporphyrinogen-III synthase [Thermoplasmata archaeon]|nr:uroporphyrinogen-III synthase [Thermoplasmata archaeon]
MTAPESRGRHPTVVLLSTPGVMDRIDAVLARAGVRLVRVQSVEPHEVDPLVWIRRISKRTRPDTVVVTSRWAVRAGVQPWRKIDGPFSESVEFWAVGPATAAALRRAGVTHVRTPDTVGAEGIATALAKGPKRRVVYLRSDLAGSKLVRALRAQGHRVSDVVVYTVQMPPPLSPVERGQILAADALVVTSPSGLADLSYRIGRSAFARLQKNARLVVLGERSRRAAVTHRFAHISVAPSAGTQPFTRHLLREVRNARE